MRQCDSVGTRPARSDGWIDGSAKLWRSR